MRTAYVEVRECLIKEQRKARVLEDTREALTDIKAGRIVAGVDVISWLDFWGEGKVV